MPDRRSFLKTAAGAAFAPGILQACSTGESGRLYDEKVRELWQSAAAIPADTTDLYWDLVRHARLAPSSHNTQCWLFGLEHDLITIQPDPSRHCPVADPDDHHLYVSLGCAVENLALTATARGLHAECSFDELSGRVEAWMEKVPAVAGPLFKAIPKRQNTRSDYNGKAVPNADLKTLVSAGTGEGVAVSVFTASASVDRILEFVIGGNTEQIRNAMFRDELKSWIRFNEYDAVVTCDGLYARSLGNPETPSWLGRRLFDVFLTEGRENDRLTRQVRSSAGIAVFHSAENTPAQWVEVGRAYQRFALQATLQGIRTAMVNQAVEIPAIRAEFARHLGLGQRRPDLIVRFGYGPEMPRSLRRMTKDMILGIRCM